MTPHPDSPPLASPAGSAPAEAPTAAAATAAAAAARADAREHRRASDLLHSVRASDIEPYTGLGYLSKLFRLIAILLLVLLVAEVGVGVASEGVESLRTLITEASRLIVVAGVLWGAGDLATLLIDIGHDVRATRILLARHALHPHDAPLADHDGRAEERARSAPRAAEARRLE